MKTKHKARDIKRPNPYIHMIRWGAGSGTITGILVVISLFNFAPVDILVDSPSLYFWGLIISGIPGLILGCIQGWILSNLLRDVPKPFTLEGMENNRKKIYLMIGGTTTVLLLLFLFFSPNFFDMRMILLNLFYLVPFVAGILAAYASHRYLLRFLLWSEWEDGLQAEMVKNFERLEDKLNHKEIDFEDEAQSHASRLS